MNLKWKAVLGAAIIFLVSWKFFSSAPTNPSSQRGPASENGVGYCIALRGNGEAEPAHWGALARTVEQLGLPSGMAGGSSATISMFLVEAIASHPMILGQSPEDQKQRASLMLKSMTGFFSEIQKSSTWNDLKRYFGLLEKSKNGNFYQDILNSVSRQDFSKALGLIEKGIELGALDPASFEPFIQAVKASDRKRAIFFANELIDSAKTFGSFDAKSENLFFRMGIVNFEKAAASFGKIAAFYSLASQDTAQSQNWKAFFDLCQKGSTDHSWIEIVRNKPACAASFSKLFETEFSGGGPDLKIEEASLGSRFPVYATTAVLTGESVAHYRREKKRYLSQLSKQFGAQYHPVSADDVRFGYWGNPSTLQRIEEELDHQDEKGRRFVALGSASWKQVLSLSPAEPGLSPLKEFVTESGKEFVSAGGWSDLHPVQILKASGCGSVLYITRQGGESSFAQGVAKRLFQFERDWADLSKSDTKDFDSLWSRLYNLGNPQSSFNQALKQADAVMCTNWNDYPVQSRFLDLIEDSYRSSYWLGTNARGAAISRLTPVLNKKKIGCAF